jgi:hypothetical protein
MAIRAYIVWLTASFTVGYVGSAVGLSLLGRSLLGLGYREVPIILVAVYPVTLFAATYGFYKGLVKHYGFQGKERLFPFDPL